MISVHYWSKPAATEPTDFMVCFYRLTVQFTLTLLMTQACCYSYSITACDIWSINNAITLHWEEEEEDIQDHFIVVLQCGVIFYTEHLGPN